MWLHRYGLDPRWPVHPSSTVQTQLHRTALSWLRLVMWRHADKPAKFVFLESVLERQHKLWQWRHLLPRHRNRDKISMSVRAYSPLHLNQSSTTKCLAFQQVSYTRLCYRWPKTTKVLWWISILQRTRARFASLIDAFSSSFSWHTTLASPPPLNTTAWNSSVILCPCTSRSCMHTSSQWTRAPVPSVGSR